MGRRISNIVFDLSRSFRDSAVNNACLVDSLDFEQRQYSKVRNRAVKCDSKTAAPVLSLPLVNDQVPLGVFNAFLLFQDVYI